MDRYAVWLSGGINLWNNHARYLNDLKMAYPILTQHYGFEKDRVFAVYADGSPVDLDGDGRSEVYCEASPSRVSDLFDQLAASMDSADLFYLFVSNHGGATQPGTTRVHIWLWYDTYLTHEELADLLDRLPGRAMLLVFGQCYGGSLIATLAGPNRVICTACAWDEVSWARPGRVYDEFLYHFLSTLRGQTPEGGSVPHNQTIREAFLYARAQDSRPEHPQYSDPSAIGSRLTLHGLP
jgi:hypothetical protein